MFNIICRIFALLYVKLWYLYVIQVDGFSGGAASVPANGPALRGFTPRPVRRMVSND
jgi:hypothetical protein